MSFSTLGLSDAIVRAVSEQGYTAPTPIQSQAIPAVLNGGDLLAGAQTGTGKTAGFTLPILHRLSTDAIGAAQRNKTGARAIRALVLTPTRELAAQVEESVRLYGKYTNLNSAVILAASASIHKSSCSSTASTSWWRPRAACWTIRNRSRSRAATRPWK